MLALHQKVVTKVELESAAMTQEISDEALIAAICQKAEWAMKFLYERYYRYVYTLAYHVLRDHGLVEDILQDAFLSVWNKANLYQRQQGTVRSWLQAIVYHRAIDFVRSSAAQHQQQWQSSLPTEDQPEIQFVDGQPDVWDKVWNNERALLIRGLLNELPEEQRQVIEWSYFGGLTHIEISERWNIPLGTVKGRMRLGLQKMRRLLLERGLDSLY